VAGALPIVGRGGEREALSAAYRLASAEGRSQLVLITGPASHG
jgi:hypothetical protein